MGNRTLSDSQLTEAILHRGTAFAAEIGAKAVFTSFDAIEDPSILKSLPVDGTELVLVVREKRLFNAVAELGFRNLRMPPVPLSRMGQIKTAVIIAFSQRMLDTGETVVFEQALTLALELATEGREGKSVGALFVVGDYRNVIAYRQQSIINPFRGYSEKSRNILDEGMRDTVKNFAKLDGAFIIKGNGVIAAAGSHLKGVKPSAPLPPGLGSRHAAAAGITAITKSIAITISESTGTVRIWRRGQIITEIERPTPGLDQGPLPTLD